MHVRPAPHALPHAPQLVTSFEVETQRPLQNVAPAGQVQVALTHAVPIGQALPHTPQFAPSLEVETHAPPQFV